jgi:UDP-N-acetyl-2-amino-2-deoxyglucuronate dehydrogenase
MQGSGVGLRFGLVGSGLAGPLFSGALATQPGGAELVAVASRQEDRARTFAEQHGIPRWFSRWQDLVSDPDINVVCIATPTGTHRDITVAAAAAGKHVLTEKPMATTLKDADAMIAACATADVQLGVIFMYRFMDTAIKMKEAIDNGLIGRPIFGECVGKFWRDQTYYDSADWRGTWAVEGGGSLMTQTSHTLDLMLWMLGPVAQAAGFFTVTPSHTIETEDLVVGSLRFASGALGSVVSSSAITPPVPRSLTIHGERGTVRLTGDQLTQWDVSGETDDDVRRMLKESEPDRGDTAAKAGYADSELHRRQIEEFVAAVQENRPPAIDGKEGRRTLEVMRALYQSSVRNEVISLPIKEDRTAP